MNPLTKVSAFTTAATNGAQGPPSPKTRLGSRKIVAHAYSVNSLHNSDDGRAGGTQTVGIIGAGAVGASIALSLIHKSVCPNIMMFDIDEQKCIGEALDCQDAGFFTGTNVQVADLPTLAYCDVVVITAGAKQRKDEPRTALVDRNAKILDSIIKGMFPHRSPPNPDLILLLVSNPVDVLTSVAQHLTQGILPSNQIIGSGTYLDSERLRIALAHRLDVSPKSIHASVVGEHGDSQLIAWAAAEAGGRKLTAFPQLTPESMSDIERYVRRKAYEIIARKGATSHGIGSSVAQMCRCILRDSKEVLPLSVFVPELGTCLGWPAIVGRHGAEALPDLELSSHERRQLQESAKALTEILATVNMPN